MKTAPIPVRFDRQDQSCNFYVGSGPISISLGLLTLVRARRSPEACDVCACVNFPTHIRCVCFLACACVCARSARWHAVCVSLPVCALRTVVYVCVFLCVCVRYVCVCVLCVCFCVCVFLCVSVCLLWCVCLCALCMILRLCDPLCFCMCVLRTTVIFAPPPFPPLMTLRGAKGFRNSPS